MGDSEKEYLLQLWDAGICPNCGNVIPQNRRIGSGKKSEGGFCSVNCSAEYHQATLIERHQKRLAAVKRHRDS